MNAEATAQSQSISYDFDLQHPPAKVWRAISQPELLSQWLLPVVDLELRPGAEFTLKSEPMPGWDGLVHCQMLEVEPERKLSWNWVVGPIDTVVTFTLTPTDSGTRLSILHTGFKPDQKQNLGGARYGWNMMTGKLLELLPRIE